MKHKIGILGAGTWGMALARMLTVSGNDVTVWSALEQEIDNLATYVSIPFAQTELDGHPTVSGHKYIADKIVKAIEAQQ